MVLKKPKAFRWRRGSLPKLKHGERKTKVFRNVYMTETENSVTSENKSLVDPKLLKAGAINDKNMLARLFEAGFTHEEIADHFGVSRVAVTNMINRMELQRKTSNPAEFQEKMQEEILIRMENILKYMSPDKLNKASLSQLIIAFGTLYDKYRLSRGESTSNTAVLNIQKIADSDLDKIREIIAKSTQEKLQAVRKTYHVDT